jgi:hypothetical protein
MLLARDKREVFCTSNKGFNSATNFRKWYVLRINRHKLTSTQMPTSMATALVKSIVNALVAGGIPAFSI